MEPAGELADHKGERITVHGKGLVFEEGRDFLLEEAVLLPGPDAPFQGGTPVVEASTRMLGVAGDAGKLEEIEPSVDPQRMADLARTQGKDQVFHLRERFGVVDGPGENRRGA